MQSTGLTPSSRRKVLMSRGSFRALRATRVIREPELDVVTDFSPGVNNAFRR